MDDRPVHATTYDSGEFNKTVAPAGDHALPTTETNSTQPGVRAERGADRTMPYLLGLRHGSLAGSRGQTLLPAMNDVGAARKRGGAHRVTANGRTRPPDGAHPVMGLDTCKSSSTTMHSSAQWSSHRRKKGIFATNMRH